VDFRKCLSLLREDERTRDTELSNSILILSFDAMLHARFRLVKWPASRDGSTWHRK